MTLSAFTHLSFSHRFARLVCLFFLFLNSYWAVSQTSEFGWSRSYGAAGHDQGNSIKVENNGYTFFTGSFQDSLAFDSTTIVLHSQGVSDAFIAKFRPNGKAVWAKKIGGAGQDLGLRLSLDRFGYLYVTGSFTSPSIALGNFTLTNSDTSGTDIFLAKFDTAGTLIWAKTIGAPGADGPTGLGIDGTGNSYLTGYFSAATISLDTTILISHGGEDFFLAKHDTAGNILWAVQSGSPLNDRSSALAVDSTGNCVLTGFFTGDSIFFASDTVIHASALADPDIFLLKYDIQGIEKWAQSAGSDSLDQSTGLSLDADGFIYLAGKTTGSELNFDSVKVYNTTGQAVFLVRTNPEGEADWEATAGVTGAASGWELASDMFGSVFLMTDFSGQLQLENETFHDSTGSRILFADYTIFRDFLDSKEATGTGTANSHSIGSNDYGNTFATGSFSDSLYLDSTGLAVPVVFMGQEHEDMFIANLTPGGFGGGFGGGPGSCTLTIREVLPDCGVPGDEVLIRGLFRGKASAVSFGGIPAQIVRKTFISVTAIVPAGYTGGPVSVTVNSCTDTASFGLTPSIIATVSAQSICANTPVTLSATGAGSYLWSTGHIDSVITHSPTETTIYTVKGANGTCSASASLLVEIDTILSGFTLLGPVQPICAGSTVTLVAQGAGNYSWSNGHLSDSLTITPTFNETFIVAGSAGACTDTATVTITLAPVPSVTISPIPPALCPGDSVVLTASGASSYSWWGAGSDSSFTVSPDTTTTFTVTGTTGNCSATASVIVQVHSQSQLPAISGLSSLCEGETLQLSASAGSAPFSWSGPGGFSSNLPIISFTNVTAAISGTYSVQLLDSVCQTQIATVQVQVNSVPVLSLTPQVQNILPGTPIHITATGATHYLWIPGSNTSNILSAAPQVTTQYVVTGTTAGCTATDSATVIVTPLVISAGSDQFLCGQVSATLSASISPAGTGGNWSVLNGSGGSFSDISSPTAVFLGQAGQQYTLQWQANQVSGALGSATVQVHFGAIPDLPVIEPVTVCSNSSANLVTSGPATTEYVWYQNVTQQPVAFGNSYITPVLNAPTEFFLVARNGACETPPVSVLVGLNPTPEVESGADVTVIAGKQVRLQASGAVTYSWSPPVGLDLPLVPDPVASPSFTTTYTVTGLSEFGCPNRDWVTVTVLPNTKPANVFTPNSDGVNDQWDITALRKLYPDGSVEVFNRWGQTVFKSRLNAESWDGKSDGKDLSEGTYFYSIQPGNGDENINGTVVLTR